MCGSLEWLHDFILRRIVFGNRIMILDVEFSQFRIYSSVCEVAKLLASQ